MGYLSKKLVEVFGEGSTVTSSAYKRRRAEIGAQNLPTFQTILNIARRLARSTSAGSDDAASCVSFHDALRIITHGKLNSQTDAHTTSSQPQRSWSDQELVDTFARWQEETKGRSQSVYEYNEWQKQQTKAPSPATFMFRFGGWQEAVDFVNKSILRSLDERD